MKSVSYFRPAQVFDFTLSNPVQSLSDCCDNSLVSSSTPGEEKSTVYTFIRALQPSFLLYSSLLLNENRPVL